MLDSKGLALLAFDGIVVAATTFAAEKGGVFHRRGTARWLAILTIVLSLAAAALCLLVSEISYSFFHYVDCVAPDKLDFSNEISRLATLVDWRTNLLVVLDDRNPIVLCLVLGLAELDKQISFGNTSTPLRKRIERRCRAVDQAADLSSAAAGAF